MTSSYRNDRTSYHRSSYSGMSQSYHDYSTSSRNRSNRYGSTEQLHYKSPFINSSGYGSSSFYRSNNNFTKAGSVGYSVPDTSSRSYRDYASTSSYSNNSSASKYRTSYGLSSSLSYQPKTNFDIRSKTPSYERESNSQANFFNRDCRSVPRIEKISLNTSESNDVDKAYQKLCDKYVKDDSDRKIIEGKTNNLNHRSFISYSDADGEECTSEDDQSKISSSSTETQNSHVPKQKELSSQTYSTSIESTPKCSPIADRTQKIDSIDNQTNQCASNRSLIPPSSSKVSADESHQNMVKPSVLPEKEIINCSHSKDTNSITSSLSNSQESESRHVIGDSVSMAEESVPSHVTDISRPELSIQIPQSVKESPSENSIRNSIQKNESSSDDDFSTGLSSSIEDQVEQNSNDQTMNFTISLDSLKETRSKSVTTNNAQASMKENTLQLPNEFHNHNGRKRRDPARSLENLMNKLDKKKNDEESNDMKQMSEAAGSEEIEGIENESELTSKPLPPLLLVTTPSQPSTPMNETNSALVCEESTDGDWTEAEDEADYESDFEYSISQTFSLKDARPIGDLYPLDHSPTRCSPFVSDYDSDGSMPLFTLPSRAAESRGRVDSLLAVPPPSFTCSITYDGQESWDEDSLHSCADFDDEYYGRQTRSSRPASSTIDTYLSPTSYSSEEDFDGTHFHDEVDVGCTLRLVDKAALRGDSEEESDYSDEEYSGEEYWDEDEEYDEDESYHDDEEQNDEEEEKEESAEDDDMHSVECSTDEETKEASCELVVALPAEVEEDVNYEEIEDEFEVNATVELATPQVVQKTQEYPELRREITYTKDLKLLTEVDKAEQLNINQDETAKAIKKRVIKDGTSEKVTTLRIPQRVAPVEETITYDESTILPDEEIYELNLQHHEEDKGTHDVAVVPTYVRPQTEKFAEESTRHFSNKKVATDFARKAVIQPPKLQTASTQKVETKIAPEQVPIPFAAEKPVDKPLQQTHLTNTKSVLTDEDEKTTKKTMFRTPEDKSGVRKSALNMSSEDAKNKAAADEEVAKRNSRRLGTVSSLLNRFKESEPKEEPITYKRSSYLQSKEVERPKKQYNIIKPSLDDNFDEQMEAIRAQMKSGSSQFESHLKDLSKGITMTSEDMKKRTEEEKKKIILDSVSGVFSKADEEKARWKEKREAETEKELAKIDEGRKYRREKTAAAAATMPKTEPEKPAEPKRTVRKIVKDKSPAVQQADSANSVPNHTPGFSVATNQKETERFARTTTVGSRKIPPETKSTPTNVPITAKNQAASNSFITSTSKPTYADKPKIPKEDTVVVNEDNYDLLEAATNVATRRRKSLVELQAQRQQQTTTKSVVESNESTTSATRFGPKGDGAVATKIRHALSNSTNVRKTETTAQKSEREKPLKRYVTRRKTQEIVNESAEPKIKKRKQLLKRNRFIRDPHDIDVLLGWDKENTFEKMDQMFSKATSDRINTKGPLPVKKRKRLPASKIWISDLTDIDKIYKMSEIRDITASANE